MAVPRPMPPDAKPEASRPPPKQRLSRWRPGRGRAFKLKTYSEQLERFHAQLMEAYLPAAGRAWTRDWPAGHLRRARQPVRAAPRSMRCASAAAMDDDAGREARELLSLGAAASTWRPPRRRPDRASWRGRRRDAVVVWRGERIPYRQVWNRAADIANRTERNALAASYLAAVEAINPLREERHGSGSHAAVRELGFADVPAMVGQTAGFDSDALAGRDARASCPTRRRCTSPRCVGTWPRSTSSRAMPPRSTWST